MVGSMGSDGRTPAHDRPAPLRGPYRERPADVFHSFAHVSQSVSAGLAVHTGRTAPIVFDLQRELIRLQLQSEPDGGGLRVPDDVGHGLLEARNTLCRTSGEIAVAGNWAGTSSRYRNSA